MGSFFGTGAVYFLWPVLILTLIFEYAWCILAVLIAFGAGMPKGVAKRVLKDKLLPIWITSIGVNAALVLATYILYWISQDSPRLASWLEHPFSGLGGTLAALGCIALVLGAGLLKYVLYRRIVLKKLKDLGDRERLRACRRMAVLTTPWLYLLPTAAAYEILGTIMMGLGSLAPGELPVE